MLTYERVAVKVTKEIPGYIKLIWSHWSARIGLVISIFIVFIAIFAPLIAPRDYAQTDLKHRLEPPSPDFPFGTDELGRCIFSRVIYGSRIALWVGILVVLVEALVGVTLGIIAGYWEGWIDRVISFLSDSIWALPPIVLALGVVTVIGPGISQVVTAIAIVSWPPFTRVSRAKVLSIKNREFVIAAKAIGESDISIIARYILPNIIPSILVLATLTLPTAILSTTALSFLGFGAQPPTPDWGDMIAKGMGYLQIAPWISAFPGIFLVITSLGFNLLGDGLRDLIDPRLRI
ncbi:ABC transporter permease [Candidatus Korarchaeum cryptofilum]|uniref:ABC transporter permease n=1 Tax=Candidatus Korarchaeum cryptofilum TaxID=498846 RepID=UPI001F441CFC|nr:ABC transporter permease [Candidatus Korarchaeum cryptofilum]